MVRRTFLDDDRQAELEQRGFTILRILEPHEAASALQRVQALRPSDGFAPQPGSPTPYHCTFLDPDRSYKQAVDDLTRELFEDRTCALLDDHRMLTSNVYVKPPGTGRFEIHQNWPVTDDIRDTTITLWCPLVDAGPQNGTIQVIPGSHKIVPDTFSVGAPKYFNSFYDELIDHWLEPVTLRAGECILFDDGLLHWSDINRSDTPRWSAQLVFMPAEKTPVIYYFNGDDQPAHFELFEIGPEFFIDHGVDQLIRRPTGLRSLGTAPARHLALDEPQFRRIMDLGPRTRELVYAGASMEDAFAGPIEVAEAHSVAGAPSPAHEVAPAACAPEARAERSAGRLRRRWRAWR